MPQYACEVCHGACDAEVIVCAFCNVAGHEGCIRPTYLEGYAFCSTCTPRARTQWERAQLAQQQERWTTRLASQISGWRSAVATTTGAMGAAGVAIGGVSSMMVGGTVALVRGAVQGALAGSQGSALPMAIADAVASADSASTHTGADGAGVGASTSLVDSDAGTDGARVSGSLALVGLPTTGTADAGGGSSAGPGADLGRLSLREQEARGHCVACHTDNPGHRKHLRSGDCLMVTGKELAEWGHCAACHDGLAGHRVHIRRGNCRLADQPLQRPSPSGSAAPPGLQLIGAEPGRPEVAAESLAGLPSGSGAAGRGEPAQAALESDEAGSAPTGPQGLSEQALTAVQVLQDQALADRVLVPDSFESLLDLQPLQPQQPPQEQPQEPQQDRHTKFERLVLAKLDRIQAEVSHHTARHDSAENAIAVLRFETLEVKSRMTEMDNLVNQLRARIQQLEDECAQYAQEHTQWNADWEHEQTLETSLGEVVEEGPPASFAQRFVVDPLKAGPLNICYTTTR